jgi:hypothetical protein
MKYNLGKLSIKSIIFFFISLGLLIFVISFVYNYLFTLSTKPIKEGLTTGTKGKFYGIYKLSDFPADFQAGFAIKETNEKGGNRWNPCKNHEICIGEAHMVAKSVMGLYDTGCVFFAVAPAEKPLENGKPSCEVFANFNNDNEYKFDSSVLKGLTAVSTEETRALEKGEIAFYGNTAVDCSESQTSTNAAANQPAASCNGPNVKKSLWPSQSCPPGGWFDLNKDSQERCFQCDTTDPTLYRSTNTYCPGNLTDKDGVCIGIVGDPPADICTPPQTWDSASLSCKSPAPAPTHKPLAPTHVPMNKSDIKDHAMPLDSSLIHFSYRYSQI